jgi:hypothetical protein
MTKRIKLVSRTVICPQCGREVTGVRQKYCNNHCRQIFYAANKVKKVYARTGIGNDGCSPLEGL